MLFQSPPAVGKFPDYQDTPWELKFSAPDITACFNKSTIIFLPCSNIFLFIDLLEKPGPLFVRTSHILDLADFFNVFLYYPYFL